MHVEQARVIQWRSVSFTSGSPARRGIEDTEPAAAINSAVFGEKILASASRCMDEVK